MLLQDEVRERPGDICGGDSTEQIRDPIRTQERGRELELREHDTLLAPFKPVRAPWFPRSCKRLQAAVLSCGREVCAERSACDQSAGRFLRSWIRTYLGREIVITVGFGVLLASLDRDVASAHVAA